MKRLDDKTEAAPDSGSEMTGPPDSGSFSKA
jgi:hypothetical protein